MPIRSGATGTYNQSVGIKLDIDEAIFILTPSDVPFQQWVGTTPTSSIKVEWLDEELTPQNATVAVVTGTGPWTVTVADVQTFRPNDVLHMQEQVAATRTSRKRDIYGGADPYDHELEKKFKELAIRSERAFVFGQRSISGDSQQRQMGGLFYYITTNTASGTSANAKTVLNDIIRKCYEAGGTATDAMVSPAVKAAISTNVDPSLRRSTVDEKQGGFVIDKYMSDFGELNIVVNRHFPKTKGIVMEKEYIQKAVFDPFFHELLAKTGDSDKGEIVGEHSLKVRNEKAHGTFTLTDAA